MGTAAREAALRDESLEEIAQRVEHFWALTLALIQAEAQGKKLNPRESAKFKEAVQTHELVRQGLANGGALRVDEFSKKRDA